MFSPDLLFWSAFAVKLALTAAIVVTASVVVERAGPLVAALVMTLPVSAWPAYAFLALDHDAAYIAATARASLAVNAASAAFMLVYVVLAQTRGVVGSLTIALGCWIALGTLTLSREWSVASALALNLGAYGVALWLTRKLRDASVSLAFRRWYELPLRATLVCALMATILGLSDRAAPGTIGLLAVYPVSTTCTMIILHMRFGGRASAAVIANGLWGMIGICVSLAVFAVAARPLGLGITLVLALVLPVTWNVAVWLVQRGRRRACAKAPHAPIASRDMT
jgi:hypothetical protein